MKLLTLGVVFVTVAVAGCTTSTPEPAAPAGATQDAVVGYDEDNNNIGDPPAGSYGGGVQGTGGAGGLGATDADSDPLS